MLKIILLTTDGFDLARRTAQWAVTHAKERGTQIAVFFSMPQCARDDGGDGRLIDPMLADNHASTVKKRARRHLREIDRKCAQAGVACSAIDAAIELACASDEPHEAIINAADKSGRDLIFMAVHGLGGLSARLVGSLAQKVAARCRIAVWIASDDCALFDSRTTPEALRNPAHQDPALERGAPARRRHHQPLGRHIRGPIRDKSQSGRHEYPCHC